MCKCCTGIKEIVAKSLLSCGISLFFDVVHIVGHIEDLATLFYLSRCLLMKEINFGETGFHSVGENGVRFRYSRNSRN